MFMEYDSDCLTEEAFPLTSRTSWRRVSLGHHHIHEDICNRAFMSSRMQLSIDSGINFK